MNNQIFVIAIAGHSGAGKSSVLTKLAGQLADAIVLGIDDYKSSVFPPAMTWLEDGAHPNDFQTPDFVSDVQNLKKGKSIIHPSTGEEIHSPRFLLLEEPFGRSRQAMHKLIDLVVYLDVPIDIAYTRKLLRKTEFLPWEDDPEVFMKNLRENLSWYLRVGRSFYIAVSSSAKVDCDLIIDGTQPIEEIVDEILAAMNKKSGE